MTFTATYDVTPQLQDAMAKQYFWYLLRRLRVTAGRFAISGVMILIGAGPSYRPWIAGIGGGLLLVFVVMWAVAYHQMRAQARAGFKLLDHPRVDLILDDTQIEYISSTGTRRHAWDKIHRRAETKDFVILMGERTALLSLPKSCFTPEALRFLQEKVPAHHPKDPDVGVSW